MKIYEYIVRIKDQATDKAKRISNAFAGGSRNADRFTRSTDNASKSMMSMGGFASMLTRFLGPAALSAALITAGMSASALARDMEQTSISFEVMLGSADRAKSMLGQITDMANVTPFTRKNLQDSAKLLLGFGVANDKILPDLKMLGDVSGGNSERLHYLSLAFAQASAAGRLMGQDLLQMINAGFNPLQEISQKTGISIGKLKDKMSDGLITFDMVEAAFKGATEQGGRFFGMMDRQSATFEGRLSTLRDKMEIWSGGIGEQINKFLSPVLDLAIEKLDQIIDKGNALKESNERQLTTVRKMNTELQPLINRYSELSNKQGRTVEENKELLKIFNTVRDKFPEDAGMFKDGKFRDVSSVNAKYSIDRANELFISENNERQQVLYDAIDNNAKKLKAAMNTEQHPANWIDPWNGTDKIRSEARKEILALQQERQKLQDQLAEVKGSRALMTTPFEKPQTSSSDPYKKLRDSVDKDAEKGINKITRGGKQAVNVTINIDRLNGIEKVEQISAEGTDIEELKRLISKYSVEAVLKAVNSANNAYQQ
jgi:tape measure domain-containing protein